MKKEVRNLVIILIVIFVLYHYIIFFITSGCPPSYVVEKIRYNPNYPGTMPKVDIHVTDQELIRYPFTSPTNVDPFNFS